MNAKIDLDFLQRLIKGIAAEFGSNCEVVLHDLNENLEHTIVAIENGHITGRKIGDVASDIVVQSLSSMQELHDRYSYQLRTKNGRILKSTSICIRDEQGHVSGILGINYDITDFLAVNGVIEKFTNYNPQEDHHRDDIETIPTNVSELLETLIHDSYKLINKPVALMSKGDKIKAIKYLESKGAFLITKSSDKIAKFYHISKYTLYSYLGNSTKK